VGRGAGHERDDDARGRGSQLLARRPLHQRRPPPNAPPVSPVRAALPADEGSAGAARFRQSFPAGLGSEFRRGGGAQFQEQDEGLSGKDGQVKQVTVGSV
jgi:hypothetical protein